MSTVPTAAEKSKQINKKLLDLASVRFLETLERAGKSRIRM